MAILQTIRDKYAKVAGGVIALSLVGFVLMDATSGGGGGLFGNSTAIGSIDGNDIEYKEFENAFSNAEAQYKQQLGTNTLDEATTASLRDQVWSQFVNQKILDDIYEKLGIKISPQELEDLTTGNNPDPQIVQLFTQGGQQFDPVMAANQIAQWKSDPNIKAQWENLEQDIANRKAFSKFTTLVNKSVYVPKFILDNDAAQRESYANIEYVQVPFNTVADADVKPTDEELKKYLQDHKAQFTTKQNARSISYVMFNVKPNAADSAKILGEITAIKDEFASTSNEEDIINFIGLNSDQQQMPAYLTREQLNAFPNAEEIWTAPTGTVVGPINTPNGYTLTKTMSKATYPDSVKVRHILVRTAQGTQPTLDSTAAKARIDSVATLVKSGVPFDTLVQQYSNDEGSLQTKGEYTFTLAQKSGISKEFGDFAFNGAPGSSKVVYVSNSTYSGYHYIEVLEAKNPTTVAQVAVVTKELSPSSEAFSEAYAAANTFTTKADNAETFNTAAKELNVNPMSANGLDKNSSVISGLGSSRDLVKWAYDAKMGDVSNIFTIGEKYIVAKLTGIQQAGVAALTDENRPSIEYFVMNEKKAKAIVEKHKDATLATLATTYNTPISTADSVNQLQTYIPGIGDEPKVSGYIFGKQVKPNTTSPGLKANNGVFYVNVKNTFKVPLGERNEPMERKMLQSQIEANISNAVITNLREAYKIEDKRGDFY